MPNRTAAREDFLADIVTTAIEGGVNYWATVDTYRWASRTLSAGTAELGPAGGGNAYATLTAMDDDDQAPKQVDLETVAAALQTIRGGEVKYLAEGSRQVILAADRANTLCPDDGGDIDAGLADEIVQIGLFGEVVYG